MLNVVPLFERNLSDFDSLPDVIKEMHDVIDDVHATGRGDIIWGDNPLAKMFARIFGFPKPGNDIPVEVIFKRQGENEILSRNYNGDILETHFMDHPSDGVLLETFMGIYFDVKCEGIENCLHMTFLRAKLWNVIPLPLFVLPKVKASECDINGKYHFNVDITMPLIGRVIWYKGYLVKTISNPVA